MNKRQTMASLLQATSLWPGRLTSLRLRQRPPTQQINPFRKELAPSQMPMPAHRVQQGDDNDRILQIPTLSLSNGDAGPRGRQSTSALRFLRSPQVRSL